MHLKNIVISERNQMQRITYCIMKYMIFLKWQNYNAQELLPGALKWNRD